MLDPYLLENVHQRHRELMHEARQKQLADEALSADLSGDPFYYETLAALGRQLCYWGEQLQTRYDTLSRMSAAEDSSTEMAALERV